MFFLDIRYSNWLDLGYAVKIPIFAGLCFLGLATFAIAAKLTGAMDFTEIMSMILKKGKKNV